MVAGKSATIDDVAQEAGVSRQTVSNVLNNPAVVREGTRNRVLETIARMHYRPHASARRLRTRRSATLGVRLDAYAGGISGVLLDRFLHALTEGASDRGIRVLLFAARTAADEVERMTELVDGGDIDATVITGTFRGDPRIPWLNARGLPFLSFGRPWGDDVNDPAHLWVDVDGAAGTRSATGHALATAGDHVAFLGWPAVSETGNERERGWREAIGDRAGGKTAVRLTALEDVIAARDVTAQALAGHDIDAIVCASDSLAVGAHLAAIEIGRRRLPVIGFDNTPVAEALELSSVEQFPEQIAAKALDLLFAPDGSIADHADGDGPTHALIEPRLVIRQPATAEPTDRPGSPGPKRRAPAPA